MFVFVADICGQGFSDMRVEFKTQLETVSQAMLGTSEIILLKISDYCVNSVVVNNHLQLFTTAVIILSIIYSNLHFTLIYISNYTVNYNS